MFENFPSSLRESESNTVIRKTFSHVAAASNVKVGFGRCQDGQDPQGDEIAVRDNFHGQFWIDVSERLVGVFFFFCEMV